MARNMTLASNSEFKNWVSQLKKDIRSAQVKAAIKVNTELLRLYWRMGADICEKQKSASWGDGWLKELSRELMAEFPDMKGLSYRNLKYVRQWYQFYNEQLTIGQQVAAQLGDVNMQQPVAQISEEVFFSVPWGHHLYIISQCKDVNRAVFYLKKTVENGSYMFKDCKNLKGFDSSKIDHKYANCGTDGYFTPGCAYAEFDNATGTLTFRYLLYKQ